MLLVHSLRFSPVRSGRHCAWPWEGHGGCPRLSWRRSAESLSATAQMCGEYKAARCVPGVVAGSRSSVTCCVVPGSAASSQRRGWALRVPSAEALECWPNSDCFAPAATHAGDWACTHMQPAKGNLHGSICTRSIGHTKVCRHRYIGEHAPACSLLTRSLTRLLRSLLCCCSRMELYHCCTLPAGGGPSRSSGRRR